VKLQKSGRYSVGFATAVAVGKYADHLPLQWQVVQMRRQGLQIDSQTLWDQLFALSEHLEPAYEALHEHVLSHPVVGADEMMWRLMGQKAVTNTKRWQVWVLSAPDAVVYQLHPSRSADAAAQLLKGFEGIVMCDGYSVYQALQKRLRDVKLAHCWSHARRKFVETEQSFPKPCEEALTLIGELYRIEREIEDQLPDVRLLIRQQRAGPVVQQIHRWAPRRRGALGLALRAALRAQGLVVAVIVLVVASVKHQLRRDGAVIGRPQENRVGRPGLGLWKHEVRVFWALAPPVISIRWAPVYQCKQPHI